MECSIDKEYKYFLKREFVIDRLRILSMMLIRPASILKFTMTQRVEKD